MGTPVGDSKPGIRPMRLQTRMKIKMIEKNAVYGSLWCPMISWLWPSTNPSTLSKECCRAPGESTERRDRTSKKRTSRKKKTSNSIEKEFEIGAAGYFGS